MAAGINWISWRNGVINRLSCVFPISFVYIYICLLELFVSFCFCCYFNPPLSHPTRSDYCVCKQQKVLWNQTNNTNKCELTFASDCDLFGILFVCFFISYLMPLFRFSERKSRHSARLSNPHYALEMCALNINGKMLHIYHLFLPRNRHRHIILIKL